MALSVAPPVRPKAWRRVRRGLGMLLGVLLAVVLAWVASNVIDSAPTPTPAALQLPPPSVPDARNAFYPLVGLRAPGKADPRVVGRQRWSEGAGGPETAGIAVPSGAPFDCGEDGNDCGATWLGRADELQAQLSRYVELGARCGALAQDVAFEELLPPEGDRRWTNGQPAPHALNASLCSRWLLAQAVIAASRGDLMETARRFEDADRFGRAVLEGSRSLVGNAVAWAQMRREWRVASTVVAARPALAPAMRGLETPLPLAVREASHWIPAEAAFQRATLAHLKSDCRQYNPAAGFLERLLCRTGLGLLPNVSHADIDAQWMQALAATRDGLAPALNRPPFATRGDHRYFAWRNTFGRLLLALGFDAQAGYVARQADLLLHHKAFVLAQAMVRAQVPPSGRAAWLAAQPLDADLRARLHLQDNALVADDSSAAHGATQARYRIRIPLPPS
jgi:hypothetical protein